MSYIELGSFGKKVMQLQKKLHKLGLYNGKLNGSFDTLTQEAVYLFQDLCGLVLDGIVGPQTQNTLEMIIQLPENLRFVIIGNKLLGVDYCLRSEKTLLLLLNK